MSLNFYVGEVQAQTSAAMITAKEASQAASLIESSVKAFLSAPLSSETYDSAKRYFSVAYTPLKQAMILASEAYSQAHQKLINEYNGTVGGGDVEEDRLRDKIQEGQQLIQRLQDQLYENMKQNEGMLDAGIAGRIDNAQAYIRETEQRLERLYTYNAASAGFFSDYQARLSELEAGVAAVANSQAWNASSGTFDVKKLDMSWSKPIVKAWKERQDKLDRVALEYKLANKEIKYQYDNFGTFIGVTVDGEEDIELSIQIRDALNNKEVGFLEFLNQFGSGFFRTLAKNNGIEALEALGIRMPELVDEFTQSPGYITGNILGNIASLVQAGAEYLGGGLWLFGGEAATIAGSVPSGGSSLAASPAVIAGTAAIWEHATIVSASAIRGFDDINWGGYNPESEIKNVYKSIKDAPKYPEGFVAKQNGTKNNTVKNKDVLSELRKVESGEWKKVYKDGWDKNGEPISIHYFQSKSGKVVDVDVKRKWSNKY